MVYLLVLIPYYNRNLFNIRKIINFDSYRRNVNKKCCCVIIMLRLYFKCHILNFKLTYI